MNNPIEIDNLNELAEKEEKLEDAPNTIKQYESLRTKRKGIISVAYYRGKLFKCSKEKEKIIQMVSKWKIHKSTVISKINIFKLIQKHPKLIKSSVTTFLKNYLTDIKQICEENSSEFE